MLKLFRARSLIILPYSKIAAEWYAKQRAILNEQGKMPAYADGEIAAIAAANNLTLGMCTK
ncbi:hypothetical protein [Bathymodiolus platifrons methanotrophic gill symbiont]|uniref:hypothetical protein n=1 Tax=Bathymodiolus platifrons methanotrophic gill symbiont TaxID=113268 RepID=UPI001C8E2666|nr:hypothetical protein [Bathymodiolus platifrons methanotrophic gill symbiont]